MSKMDLKQDNQSGPAASGSAQPKDPAISDSKRYTLLRTIKCIVHACQCRGNRNCTLISCQKMKKVILHAQGCRTKSSNGCPICKQLIAICVYHAKTCDRREGRCQVPYCGKIREKLGRQTTQQGEVRSLETRLLERRMAVMKRLSKEQTADSLQQYMSRMRLRLGCDPGDQIPQKAVSEAGPTESEGHSAQAPGGTTIRSWDTSMSIDLSEAGPILENLMEKIHL